LEDAWQLAWSYLGWGNIWLRWALASNPEAGASGGYSNNTTIGAHKRLVTPHFWGPLLV